MKKFIVFVIFIIACPLYAHAQLLAFRSAADTIYYEDSPSISAVLYADATGIEEQIFATSFRLSCFPGRIDYDSSSIITFNDLRYGIDLLSISGNINSSLGYGLTGISPGIDLKEHLDSIIINFPIKDLNPDDSIIEVKISDIIKRDYSGISTEYNDQNLTILLVQKAPDGIENLIYNKVDGLTAFYDKSDASVHLNGPQINTAGALRLDIYDLNGRPVINKLIQNIKEPVSVPQLISGIYFIEIKFRSNQEYKVMTTKLIIPY